MCTVLEVMLSPFMCLRMDGAITSAFRKRVVLVMVSSICNIMLAGTFILCLRLARIALVTKKKACDGTWNPNVIGRARLISVSAIHPAAMTTMIRRSNHAPQRKIDHRSMWPRRGRAMDLCVRNARGYGQATDQRAAVKDLDAESRHEASFGRLH